ncbi:hypothetical protein [Photobacterium toruni]|uniref:hypothetical protein n=1 Tax=Photobacterium toruni TaxID=1935446 RepID=UPI0021107DAF|nr:hypothetical protein [Photobacterium toruni]
MLFFASISHATPTYHVEVIKRSKNGLCIINGFSGYTKGLVNIDISFVNSSSKLFHSMPKVVHEKPDMIIFPDVYRKRHQTLNLLYHSNIPVISRDGIAPIQLRNGNATTISMTNLYTNQATSIYSFIKQDLKKQNKKKTTVILMLNESYEYAKRLGYEIQHTFQAEYNNDISVVRIRYVNELSYHKVKDGDYFISLLFEPMSAVFYRELVKTKKHVTLINSDLGITDNSFGKLLLGNPSNVNLFLVSNGAAIFSQPYLDFMNTYCANEGKNNYGMMLFEMLDISYEVLKNELLIQMPFIDAINFIKYPSGFSREPLTFNKDGIYINKTIIRDMTLKCGCGEKHFISPDGNCKCDHEDCKCMSMSMSMSMKNNDSTGKAYAI